jgi:multimeric flavodoxin WrbA
MKYFSDYIEENTNKKIKILMIQGSPRTKVSCSGGDSKTRYIIDETVEKLKKDIDFDILDLNVRDDQPIVMPCKGCVGTANGFQCHWPCSCYSPNDKNVPDFMHDEKVYERLEEADGFAVFTPVHWYACSTQVKAMFDRLVCANLTLTVEEAKKLTDDDIKNPKKNIKLEQSGKYKKLLKNHLEGKVAAFFIHGNNGANDYEGVKIPLSMADCEHKITSKEAIMPIVNQCRYSGIFAPDHLIEGFNFASDKPYSESNELIKRKKIIIEKSVNLIINLEKEIKNRNNHV